MLSLIDIGAEDIIESEDGLEVYVAPESLAEVHQKVTELGFEVTGAELIMRPKNMQTVESADTAAKALKFIEEIEDHEDVQKVFTNLDIPDEILQKIGK